MDIVEYSLSRDFVIHALAQRHQFDIIINNMANDFTKWKKKKLWNMYKKSVEEIIFWW